jgi:ADP-ribose pyrophosphatase YjhB (NUDIX family)
VGNGNVQFVGSSITINLNVQVGGFGTQWCKDFVRGGGGYVKESEIVPSMYGEFGIGDAYKKLKELIGLVDPTNIGVLCPRYLQAKGGDTQVGGGGAVKIGETFDEAARAEIKEELRVSVNDGVDLTFLGESIGSRYQNQLKTKTHFFACNVNDCEPIRDFDPQKYRDGEFRQGTDDRNKKAGFFVYGNLQDCCEFLAAMPPPSDREDTEKDPSKKGMVDSIEALAVVPLTNLLRMIQFAESKRRPSVLEFVGAHLQT